MPDEKTQGGGAATEEALGPNTVRVTFLPENKSFEFEHGKLPYQEHGKPESILDVAMRFGLHLSVILFLSPSDPVGTHLGGLLWPG